MFLESELKILQAPHPAADHGVNFAALLQTGLKFRSTMCSGVCE